MIRNLPVKCDNGDKGCVWVGTIGTLEKHVTKCNFALLPCPNNCEDDGSEIRHFLWKDLGKHVDEDCPNRQYKCENCGREDTYTCITTSHYEDCPVVVLSCPKRPCTEMLQRQYLERHIETECKHAVVCCKYKGLGCEREMKREDMAAHEEDNKLHLHMAIDTTAKLSKSLAEFKDDRAIFCDRITSLEHEKVKLFDKINKLESNPITLQVVNAQNVMDNNVVFESPYFYISPKSYYVGLVHFPTGYPDSIEDTHMFVDINLGASDYDDTLSWPFKAEATVTLLNQLEDKNHFSKTNTVTVDEYVAEFPNFILRSKLGLNSIKNTQYLKLCI